MQIETCEGYITDVTSKDQFLQKGREREREERDMNISFS